MVDIGHVFVELGALMVLLALLGRIAGRFGLPTVPLYLLAGLALGEGGLVPIEASEEFIEIGSELGVVLLLLLLGLEYSAGELMSGLREHRTAGLVDLVANATPGVLAGLLLGWDALAVVLLGGVTYVSSSGIIARLVGDLGRVGNRETPVVLTLLVTEDLVMAIFLPIVGALLVGAAPAEAAISIAIALAAVAASLLLATRYSAQVSRLLYVESPEMLVLTVLGLAVLGAGAAHELEISAAVGAFLVGIMLSGDVADAGRRLLAPMRDIFAGLFFVFFGLRVDPADLPGVLAPAAVLAVVGASTKFFTGWWAARRSGIGQRGRQRAGMTLIARGEFSIVLAGLGVTAGLEPELGLLATGYVLILAVAGSLLTRYGDTVVAALGGPRRPASAG